MRSALAPAQRLLRLARAVLAQPGAHQRQRIGGRQHRAMAGPRVIRMGVRHHRAVHRAQRIDEEAAGLAKQALRQDFQPGLGMRCHRFYVGPRRAVAKPLGVVEPARV